MVLGTKSEKINICTGNEILSAWLTLQMKTLLACQNGCG